MASTKIIFEYATFSILLLISLSYVATSLNVSTLCIKEERIVLLKIRKDLKDPGNCLSSWIGKECCNWKGIECDNQTGHILRLNLQNSHICGMEWSPLSGQLNPSFTYLKRLIHLDLSHNNFQGVPIPKFIGSLGMLSYLDLSWANFSGMVPSQVGNLSNLHYLDISSLTASSIWVRDISWLSLLSNLQYLNMNFVNISSPSTELFRAVNMIPSLLELHLSFCNLDTLPPSLPFQNITSLSILDLSFNDFSSTIIPSWLFNISTLTEINLYFSYLSGPLSSKFGRGKLCKLQQIQLSNNYQLTGDISELLEALSCSNQTLEWLLLSSNQLTGKLPNSLWQFNSLLELDLSNNSLSGPIPASVGNISSLGSLNLQGNMMNGEIPESIGQLTKLSTLNLLQNFWEGTMTNIHFHNLTNLISFSVSSKNKSLALKVTHDWVPRFHHLHDVEIHDCQVGPAFPNWLRNLKSLFNDIVLVLENVGISEEIPLWLFNISSQIWQLDLSHNNIFGYLPKALNFSSSYSPTVNLAFNQLKGSLPLWSGVSALYLRNNFLSGEIPVDIGKEMSQLTELDLSNNYLSGSIPLLLIRCKVLVILICPTTIWWEKYPYFGWVCRDLSNNNLSADLSSAFQNCSNLKTLVLKYNRFFGSIPKDVTKNLPLLAELLLRGNTLTGNIPEDLCHLPFLHLLDLAENRISGSIPACLGDVHGYKLPQTSFKYLMYSFVFEDHVPYTRHIELVFDGRIVDYINQMVVHSTIDLSKNDLTGEIPEKLSELVHLGALNLSWNHLTGNIPSNIGSLTDLESLDLSHNHLSGSIPPSMTSMTFLSHLNLSYNNFSGQIPVANQFGTFTDPSIYEGNPHLCGTPLPTNCSSLMLPPRDEEEDANESEDKRERFWLYGSIAFGYITGFWVVCGSLILKRSWRHAYFNFVYDMRDKLLVFIAVNMVRAKRRFGLETN
ncbi:LRR receptor-like serine/threonine-protein kinase [Arachis hypogaea]|nr:LRR receptor-like serine/threonine-protein kinase [Arachis hypogaea]